MLSIEEAEKRLLEATAPVGLERWPVERASGRVVAHDVWTPHPIPPRPVARRRGFAIRHRDAPGRFQVWGTLQLGERFEGVLGRGRAIRLEAGAPLPSDATAVVADLDLPTDGDHVSISRRVASGEGVLETGAELADRRPVVTAGSRLGSADVLMLQTLGFESVEVRRRPRVALASRQPTALSSWLARDALRLGLEVDWAPGGLDDPGRLAEAGTGWVDAVIQIGNVTQRGEPWLRKVAFHPGGELRVDRSDEVWVVYLEGAALAAWVGWRWTMNVLHQGWTEAPPQFDEVPARLAEPVDRDPERRRVWAVRRTRAEPTDLVIPIDGESAWSLRGAWGTMALEPGRESCPSGSIVRVSPWP